MSTRCDILKLLNRLHKEYPNKSPYIFGPGFGKSGFKVFDADKEIVIPDTLCINSSVLDLLSDNKTVFHIDKYMDASYRSPAISPSVSRTAALLIMLSSVGYSFHMETFPYCNNFSASQMWADMEQMAKGDHVCCTIIAMATRGRTHIGFIRQHAARCPVTPVSILDIPKFEKHVHYQPVQPRLRPPPPPPPPRDEKPYTPTKYNSASPSDYNKPAALASNARTGRKYDPPEAKDLPESFARILDKRKQ